MTPPEALKSVRYVVDAKGERTDAIIPLAAWKALLAAWKRSLELAEDQEDLASHSATGLLGSSSKKRGSQ